MRRETEGIAERIRGFIGTGEGASRAAALVGRGLGLAATAVVMFGYAVVTGVGKFAETQLALNALAKETGLLPGQLQSLQKQFEQAGILSRTHFETGKAVFELNEGKHHDHLVCIDCGRVEEFFAAEIEKRILEKLGVGQSSDAAGGPALPPVDFDAAGRRSSRVPIDGYLKHARCFYRAPEQLVHQRVDLCWDRDRVWIEHRGHRVADYERSYEHGIWQPAPRMRPEPPPVAALIPIGGPAVVPPALEDYAELCA